MTRKVVKQVKKVKRIRQVIPEDESWKPPDADKWTAPFKPLCLCAFVHPNLRHNLPDTSKGYCEHEPCPCAAAERHACEIPDNIWHTGDP